jgi:hypothetical protein
MGKVFCEAEHGGDSGHGQVGRHDTDRANRLICDASRSRGYFTPNVADAESSLLNICSHLAAALGMSEFVHTLLCCVS